MSNRSHIALGSGAEFTLIDTMRRRWGDLARGIGDDAALLSVPRGEELVASTDTALDAVHFKRSWLTPREIGYRAVTAALSDLAAMAASPLGVLISLQLPATARATIGGLADGIGDAVKAAGTVIVGGNTARGDVLGITTTVLGHAFAPLRRTGARPGDLLFVTGALGGPSAALRGLRGRRAPAAALKKRFAKPSARIREARWLSACGVTAAIDISDGLLADAGHLAAASVVGIEVQSERVPVFKGATIKDALTGGEEYELLVASRSPINEAEFAATWGIAITPIGRVVEGRGSVVVDGKRIAGRRGHDHFSR